MNTAALTAQPVASPHAHGGNSVTRTMFRVQMALVPATLAPWGGELAIELLPHLDFERLRAAWEQWNAQFLPITDEVLTHGVTPDIQADRYAPERATRGM